MPPWRGFYVNLDRSPDRRAQMESEFARRGLTGAYTRVPAVDGAFLTARPPRTAVQIACFQSHFNAIFSAVGQHFAHVMEDDSVLSDRFVPEMTRLIESGELDQIDIIFTTVTVMPHLATAKKLKAAWDQGRGQARLINLKGFYFAGCISYFVNPAARGRLLTALKSELDAGPKLEIDICLRREVEMGRLRAACVFPFLTTIALDMPSTLRQNTLTNFAINELQAAFFVEADVGAALDRVAVLNAAVEADPHLDLLSGIHRLLLSGRTELG